MSTSFARAETESLIEGLKVRVLHAPVTDGIAMSFAPLTQRTMVLVELMSANGLVGVGESWANFPSWVSIERVATIEQGIFPLVIGKDSRNITALHCAMMATLTPLSEQWGAVGPISQAISAVNIALWDLLGKTTGIAVSRLRGGRVRNTVTVYASSLGPEGVEEQGLRCRANGYGAVKVKLGFGRVRDEQILAAARATCGDGVDLYADANQAWDLHEALAMVPLLKEYDVAWIEEPLRGNQLDDLEILYKRTGVAIATGENLYGRAGFWPYVASPAIRILQPDVSKTGGLSEAFAICEMAEALGKEVIPHFYGGAVGFAATLQLAASMPSVSAIEYDIRDNPLRDDLLLQGLVPVSGNIVIPDAPGLGIALDPTAINNYSTESL